MLDIQQLIEKNLAFMIDHLYGVLNEESVGGNAGAYRYDGRTFGCAAANGLIETASGAFMRLGSNLFKIQKPDQSRVQLHVALAIGWGSYRIINIGFTVDKNDTARVVIYNSCLQWNELADPRGFLGDPADIGFYKLTS